MAKQVIAIKHVSTHSRPKAAGPIFPITSKLWLCFNTQPPEGGWVWKLFAFRVIVEFQHTAARRRLGPFTFFT